MMGIKCMNIHLAFLKICMTNLKKDPTLHFESLIPLKLIFQGNYDDVYDKLRLAL